MKTASKLAFMVFIIAIVFMLVRPSSPASNWVKSAASTLSGAIKVVTG